MRTALPTSLAHTDLAASTHAITKVYRYSAALSDLTIRIPAGSVFLLVGPNGAGKSTAIKLLLDLIEPTSGSATVLGMNPRDQPAEVRANVGYVPEQLNWGYSWMRVGRLLEHHARYFTAWDREYAAYLVREFDLRMDQKISTLSKGQSRRVHIVMALAHRPPLLILDEPTDGLDPVMRDAALDVIEKHIASSQTTVLVSTHHVSEFESIADHIAALRAGRLRIQTPLADLRRDLLRYRIDVPDGWDVRRIFGDALLRRERTPAGSEVVIWGVEAEVASKLIASGATVRETLRLDLRDATINLLRAENARN